MSKANRWVDFIRKWAADNDTTYSCALSNPKCKADYRAKYGVRKAVPAKTERERMGLEDVNVGKKAAPSRTSYYQEWRDKNKEAAEIARQQRENRLMGSEDVNIKPAPKKKRFKQQVEEYLAELEAKKKKDDEPIRVKKITIDGVIYLVDKATGTKFFDFETQNPIEDPRKATANPKSNSDTATAEQISIEIMMSIPKPNVTYTAKQKFEELAHLDKIEEIIKNSLELKKITKKDAAALRGKKSLGFVRDLINKAGSSSGGKKGLKAAWRSTKKGIQKGLDSTAEVLNMINPVYQMNTRAPEVGEVMGELSYNYALPAMVSMGYYAYIAAAESAATMMGLPPQVGREAAEILWDEMVVKQDADPRERQKSQFLGTVADRSGRLVFGGSFYRL